MNLKRVVVTLYANFIGLLLLMLCNVFTDLSIIDTISRFGKFTFNAKPIYIHTLALSINKSDLLCL